MIAVKMQTQRRHTGRPGRFSMGESGEAGVLLAFPVSSDWVAIAAASSACRATGSKGAHNKTAWLCA